MSAYMVEDQTINRVVEWLCWEVTRSPSVKEQMTKALEIDTSGYQ